ncbi:mediator of RNA polymerase II transcription subunit 1-domain-containing protein [Aspergillus cavernicola]|uniref:Mediator of RNA polymerase II transcription subunit 1 n=1 Tax=Aspergillus cavernicola TaxID=176166 RepID=A0ABR4IET8_9EURO
MATPSRQNLGATPTYLTSSPRPSGGPMHRTISLKSPSTRTPSASGFGPSNQPPSTHQYATPLAVNAENDNAISFNSPSALLALGAYGGISPSPAVHDALVGSGMNDGDIQALGIQGLKLGNARDNDEERRRHVDEVVQLLRVRVAGRGVCREGVERLAELERFESIWQDDNLNIAGNFVDLEIEFHRGQNVVKDVSLNYSTAEATDGERREEATAVLKRDLLQTPEEGERGSWKNPDNFHKNLHWLARHDKLSEEVNCFEAIEGLYESLKRVWAEEGLRRKSSGEYERLCSGWVGRPSLHRGGRIGLWLDYWVPQARVLDAKQRKSSDAMAIDESEQPADDESNQTNGNWRIAIDCEEGYPSLRVSKDWVGSEIFTVVNTAEAPSSGGIESDLTVVNWVDPPATSSTGNQVSEGMDLDSGMLGSSSPNRRFVARLEPPLDFPILAAADIYRHLGIQMPQDFKLLSYDGLLAPGWSPLSVAGSLGLSSEDTTLSGRRRSRVSVQSFDERGEPCIKQHSYTFQPFESAGGRTIKDIPFSHPRQLADILPTLRQYAFLANIIRNIFPLPSKFDDVRKNSEQARQQALEKDNTKNKGNITILSNENPNEKKLNLLLGLSHLEGDAMEVEEEDFESDPTANELKVDVTLRTQLGQAPVIMLLFTVDRSIPSSPFIAIKGHPWSKVSISFEVGLNGRVSVVDATGLFDDENNANTHENEDPARELLSKLARVLETSQDIGILVEWVRRWVRQQKSRG